MTEVSPSSKKVDDFLSSLSQLSQERLKEDRQRQRNLQRNIDELRSRSNSASPVKNDSNYRSSSTRSSYQVSAPNLKFNRSKNIRDDEVAPPLPKRRDMKEEEEDEPPALPSRSKIAEETPPRLPTRKYQDSIGLLQPVARKQAPAKPSKPKAVYDKPEVLPSNNTEPGGHRSFRDIENLIKSGKASTKTLESASEQLQEHKSKPAKPDWLSSLSSSKSTVRTKQQSPSSSSAPTSAITPTKPKPNSWIDSAVSKSPESKPKTKAPLVKPNKPKHLELHCEAETTNNSEPEFMSQFSKLKKPQLIPQKEPPVVKPKPNINTVHEPPAEFQAKFNSIARSSPTKLKEKAVNYEENDALELRSKLKKMAPAKPAKPKFNTSTYEQKDSEELRAQLDKLAHKKPPKKPIKKAATEEFKSSLNKRDPEPTINRAPDDLSFEDKLGALLSQAPVLVKASTFPQTETAKTKTTRKQASSKTLTHATKSRAKGPKRKLPKNMQSGGGASKSVNKIDSKNVSKDKGLGAEEEQESKPQEESRAPIVKKPPPIKQKPQEIKVKPRVISGELFI
ncbi:hypothetical protein CANMA_002449 [Candida margitis]|uniref:uncharacterized protein n=1 Tax=Candida margitis TaxID=1775924 RepID=UPI002227BDD7|nr:uncharacterized protein CANMA_002449 [Candida margitis]KAI5968233.1 hypothetical protein CANMA_002449 [Candida margitis]